MKTGIRSSKSEIEKSFKFQNSICRVGVCQKILRNEVRNSKSEFRKLKFEFKNQLAHQKILKFRMRNAKFGKRNPKDEIRKAGCANRNPKSEFRKPKWKADLGCAKLKGSRRYSMRSSESEIQKTKSEMRATQIEIRN